MKTIYATESTRRDANGEYAVTEFRERDGGPVIGTDPWPSRSKPTNGRRYVTLNGIRYRVEWVTPAESPLQGTPG